jgi:uncharacterized protein (TIGR02284 family)
MVTTVGLEDDVLDMLNSLITLDYDAAEAYRAAIERLERPEYQDALSDFLADHLRHTTELAAHVRVFGGTPAERPGMKSLLTTAKVAMGNIVGDGGVLRAMLSNEEDTNMAYERAAAHVGLSHNLRALLDSNLEDERRHRNWIEQALAKAA